MLTAARWQPTGIHRRISHGNHTTQAEGAREAARSKMRRFRQLELIYQNYIELLGH
jgi:hypothetical protein